MDLNRKTSLHFIGIGGESMSSLAAYAHMAGFNVSGSDRTENANTDRLEKLGMAVTNHFAANVFGKDYVVTSLAVPQNNVELVAARKLGIPIISRSEFLGLVSKRHKNCIAVAGSHGKSTTAAMIAQTLLDFGLDPAVHIGCDFPYIGGNYRFSESPYFVTEACEYKRSFLSLSPFVSVITNVELDHPDYYKNKEDLYSAFSEFAVKTSGAVLMSQNDVGKIRVENAVTCGIGESAYYGAEDLACKNGAYSFVFRAGGEKKGRVALKQLGKFSVNNALYCLAVGDITGVSFASSKRSLESFSGVARRQEVLKSEKITVMTDYSHHPTQIKNIAACFEKGEERLVGVFQPHTYSRTKYLMNEFSTAFDAFDEVFFLPTYPAREEYDEEGCSERLFENVKNPRKAFASKGNILSVLDEYVKDGDVVIFMGAGDIDKIAREFAKTH